ncbi:MAG TPA: pitrilysin family protein [Candidatus Saccharibacteria bacterium]|nr:pitrilysin family protein [Candidatus Saccharibacteria bacterium]
MPLKHSVHEVSLKNGAKGIIVDVPGTTAVSYQFHFRAGNEYVADKKREQTAHIMEHLAFGANAKYGSAAEFSQDFSKNGTYFNASTWSRSMVYMADSPLMEWQTVLDMMCLAIVQPVFKKDELESEKGNVREELTGNINNHNRTLWQHVYKAMGDDFLTDKEKLATVDRVTLFDIKRHHEQTHTARNMRFVIAGDLAKHHDEIIAKLESWPIRRGKRLPHSTVKLRSTPAVAVRRKELSNIRFVLTVVLNRELSNLESDTISALNHLLTGTFHSRIWGKARAQGICYGMGSSINTDIDEVSRWEIYGQVAVKNAPALVRLIETELSEVAKNGVTEEELESAKLYALGQYQMRAQTVAEISNWYADDYFDKEEIVPLKDVPRLIRRVTIPVIKQLVNEFFIDGEWTLGAISGVSKTHIKRLHLQLSPLFSNKVK